MSIRDGIVNPLSVFSSSSKPIKNVEQRQFLYNQERQLEKSVRFQEDINSCLEKLVTQKSNELNAVLNFQKGQNNNLNYGIDNLGYGISKMNVNIIDGLNNLNEVQIAGFKRVIQGLGITNSSIQEGFNLVLDSIENQTIIFQNISKQIQQIIRTLQNPRKISGLENKRDGIENLKNKWFDEALKLLYIASEELITDEEVFFMIGIIEFEEKKNYQEAIKNLEKAIKYSKVNNYNLYIQANDKLASIYYIIGNVEKAFNYQLESVENNKKSNISHIRDIVRYSAIIGKYEIFEKYLYELLILEPTLIVEISFDNDFINDRKNIEIIGIVTEKINKKNNEKKSLDDYNNKLEDIKKRIIILGNEINSIEYKGNPKQLSNCKYISDMNKNGFAYLQKNSGDFALINHKGEIIDNKSLYKIDEIVYFPNSDNDIGLFIGKQGDYHFPKHDDYIVFDYNFNYQFYGTSYHTYPNGTIRIEYVGYGGRKQVLFIKDGRKLDFIKGHNQVNHFSGYSYNKGYALATYNNKNCGYTLCKVYENGRFEDIKRINKSEEENILLELDMEIKFDLENTDYKIKCRIENFTDIRRYFTIIKGNGRIIGKDIRERDLGSFIDENIPENERNGSILNRKNKNITNKAIKINGGWNFLKPDGTLLFKPENYKDLLLKYKELDEIINCFLIGKFDFDGKGEIKILNEIYTIKREKNYYGGYSYKINF